MFSFLQRLKSVHITRRRAVLYILIAVMALAIARLFWPFLILAGVGWALWGAFEWYDAVDKARPEPKLKDMWRYRRELAVAMLYGLRAGRVLDHI